MLIYLMKLLPYLLEEKNYQNGIRIMRWVTTGPAIVNATYNQTGSWSTGLMMMYWY